MHHETKALIWQDFTPFFRPSFLLSLSMFLFAFLRLLFLRPEVERRSDIPHTTWPRAGIGRRETSEERGRVEDGMMMDDDDAWKPLLCTYVGSLERQTSL